MRNKKRSAHLGKTVLHSKGHNLPVTIWNIWHEIALLFHKIKIGTGECFCFLLN